MEFRAQTENGHFQESIFTVAGLLSIRLKCQLRPRTFTNLLSTKLPLAVYALRGFVSRSQGMDSLQRRKGHSTR
jgi:hypothetical protein